jgi:hypothetical protein
MPIQSRRPERIAVSAPGTKDVLMVKQRLRIEIAGTLNNTKAVGRRP